MSVDVINDNFIQFIFVKIPFRGLVKSPSEVVKSNPSKNPKSHPSIAFLLKSPWNPHGNRHCMVKNLHEIPMDMSIFGQFPSPSVHRWHRWCYSHAMVPPRHLWAVPCGAATAATARGARAGRIDRLEVRLGWKLGKSALMEEIKGLNMMV